MLTFHKQTFKHEGNSLTQLTTTRLEVLLLQIRGYQSTKHSVRV